MDEGENDLGSGVEQVLGVLILLFGVPIFVGLAAFYSAGMIFVLAEHQYLPEWLARWALDNRRTYGIEPVMNVCAAAWGLVWLLATVWLGRRDRSVPGTIKAAAIATLFLPIVAALLLVVIFGIGAPPS